MSEKTRTAIVAGGTSGIGLASAEALARAGCRVAVFGQSEGHRARAETRLLQSAGVEDILAATCDLRDRSATLTLIDRVRQTLGPPTVLVYSAGVSPKASDGNRRRLTDTEDNEWETVLDINLSAAMRCCRALLPDLASRADGRIILIGSLAGRTTPRIAGAAYAASKSAMAGLTRALVPELQGSGATVNCIAPGRIVSEMTGAAESPRNQEVLARIPVGRLGRPDDIAALTMFLVSEKGGFINGAVIDVNGGEFTAP